MSNEGPFFKNNPSSFEWDQGGKYVTLGIAGENTVASSGGSKAVVNTFVGYNNPGWKRQITSGQDATTQASGVKFSVEGSREWAYSFHATAPSYPPGRPNVQSRNTFGKKSPTFPNENNSAPGSLVTAVRNRAIRKFLDDAKSKRSSFEAGQDIGEIKQTIESFLHPMKSLKELTLKYFSKLKKAKSRYRSRISLHKALADSYLEYRFGWRPLALDIADAYSGLSDRSRMSETAPCSGSATMESPVDSIATFANFTGDDLLWLTESSYVQYTYRIKGAIRLDLVNGRIPVLQALQLHTLNDFAVTAWDLLPYSFVVDYFVNVGDIINAITFPSSKFTYCCATERTRLVDQSSYSAINRSSPNDGLSWDDPGSLSPAPNFKAIVTKWNRSHLESLDLIPTVRFALPVSTRPWENIGALITANTKALTPFFK